MSSQADNYHKESRSSTTYILAQIKTIINVPKQNQYSDENLVSYDMRNIYGMSAWG
jgi:hypothetical protein